VSDEHDVQTFARDRIQSLLDTLERVAAGDTETSLTISPRHDELDAIAFGINVLADELRWAHARISESDRIKTDELREALAHLGRVAMLDVLAGSLAHEINQPLTATTANAAAALLLMETTPPRLRELQGTLNDILNDSRRAAAVVQNMRTLLKKGAALHEPLDVNSVVSEVVSLVQRNVIARRIALSVELGSGIEPVLGNRIQIQQVVLNLLMNAFDAVHAREPVERKVQLRTRSREAVATIDVIDHGPGLSDDALAELFEPIHTSKPDGMGLGLWICRGIVTAHGGTLNVVRNAGAGLTFSANFPLWRSSPGHQKTPQATPRLQER
jgi:two-component system sensor kinase FixL